jgi:hypothetical protein
MMSVGYLLDIVLDRRRSTDDLDVTVAYRAMHSLTVIWASLNE